MHDELQFRRVNVKCDTAIIRRKFINHGDDLFIFDEEIYEKKRKITQNFKHFLAHAKNHPESYQNIALF